jgi:hypothetical protein
MPTLVLQPHHQCYIHSLDIVGSTAVATVQLLCSIRSNSCLILLILQCDVFPYAYLCVTCNLVYERTLGNRHSQLVQTEIMDVTEEVGSQGTINRIGTET